MPRMTKRVTVLLIAFVTLLTILTLNYAQTELTKRSTAHFEEDTAHLADEFAKNMDSYNTLLYSGRALFSSSQNVSQSEWEDFYKSQNIMDRYLGVMSIIYLDVVPERERASFERETRTIPYFGKDFRINAEKSFAGEYLVANRVYSDQDVSAGIGFDNYSTEDRRITHKTAEETNRPTGSQPLKLASGWYGFFVSLPVYESPGKAQGFIVLSFKADDLLASVMRDYKEHIEEHKNNSSAVDYQTDTIATRVTDVTQGAAGVELFESDNWSTIQNGLEKKQQINVAGRTWELNYKASSAYQFPRLQTALPRLISICGVLVVIVLLFAHYQHALKEKHSKK